MCSMLLLSIHLETIYWSTNFRSSYLFGAFCGVVILIVCYYICLFKKHPTQKKTMGKMKNSIATFSISFTFVFLLATFLRAFCCCFFLHTAHLSHTSYSALQPFLFHFSVTLTVLSANASNNFIVVILLLLSSFPLLSFPTSLFLLFSASLVHFNNFINLITMSGKVFIRPMFPPK